MIRDKHKGAYCELIAAAWLLKEGYEVFRNISQHGIADIVAIKDGEIYKFDVKSVNGDKNRRLTDEQLNQNVKLIRVFFDNSCEIEMNPLGTVSKLRADCDYCGKTFLKYRGTNIFCSKTCKTYSSKFNKTKPR